MTQPGSISRRRLLATAGVSAAAAVVAPGLSRPARAQTEVPDLSRPSVVQLDGRESYAFARGLDNSLMVNVRILSAPWQGFRSVGGILVGDPLPVPSSRRVSVYVRGIDDFIYSTEVTPGSATPFARIPLLQTTSRRLAVANVDGRRTIFARGYDGAIHYVQANGDGWLPPRSLGGFITSEITAVEPLPSPNLPATFVFARGADNAAYVNTRSPQGGGFRGYQRLDGLALSSSVAATAYGDRGVVAVARGTDLAGYVNTFRNGGWSGWQSLGGLLTSELTVTGFRNDIVIIGRGTDNAAYVNTMPLGGAPTGWRSLGGAITSSPYVALAIDGAFVRFCARGTDNALYLNTRFLNTDWQGYEYLGGALA